RVMDLNPIAWRFPFDMHERLIVAPQLMVETLARVARAAFELAGRDLPDNELGKFIAARDPEPAAHNIARALTDADHGFLVVGDQALFHPQAADLRALAAEIARLTDCALMVLPGPANSQGAWQAGLVPSEGGLSAHEALARGLKGWLLFDLEPDFDSADPAATRAALGSAEAVVAITAFAGTDLLETADVLLPLAPMPETEGSVVNADGIRQLLKPAGRPPEGAHDGWKILRVLGAKLSLPEFQFSVFSEIAQRLDGNEMPAAAPYQPDQLRSAGAEALWRAGPVPIYSGDSLLRRSPALQQTHHADNGWVAAHPSTLERRGLEDCSRVRLRQGECQLEAELRVVDWVPPGAVWLAAATCLASRMGPAWGEIELERCE
ncbi:MAG: molybdopterin-dependent oxidoreductase, partial [Wenzhouxiangellaceae bacterium]